jgi:hypothetical protein
MREMTRKDVMPLPMEALDLIHNNSPKSGRILLCPDNEGEVGIPGAVDETIAVYDVQPVGKAISGIQISSRGCAFQN